MSGLYKVQRIVARRKGQKNQTEYKVKWVGYPESQCTWEPTKNLRTVIEMVQEFDRKCERKGEESKPEQKDSKDTKDQKEQKEKEKQQRQKQLKEAKEQKEAEEQQKRDKKMTREEEKKKETPPVEKKQTRNSIRNIPKQTTLDESEDLPKPRNGKRNIRESDQIGLIPTKRGKPEETEDGSQSFSEERIQSLMQRIIQASGGDSNKIIKILDISKNSEGELIYLTSDDKGLRSYKSRPYMVSNHSQSMIEFYESKIQFVKTTPPDSPQ